MTKRAVIFDMDGVLVDSYRSHWQAWRKFAAAHGLEITEQQFAETFGRTGREIVRHIWGEQFKDKGDDEIMALDAEKEVYYRQALAEHFPEMPGASALLRQLHDAGFALAIGSSGPLENVAAVLAGLPSGTGKLFGATVNGMDVQRGKPDPAIFLLAAKRLGVEPTCCAVVEDAPAGIVAAKAADMAAIAVTGTVPREQLANADLIIDSLTQLNPSIIGELIDKYGCRGRGLCDHV